MNHTVLQNLKKRNINLAPLKKETSERIMRLSVATGEEAETIIDAAVRVLEYSLGKEIILHDKTTHLEEKIDTYEKYPKIKDIDKKEQKDGQ